MAVRAGDLEREAVERQRDECRVADEVAEARAREPRCALHLEAPDLVWSGRCAAGLADAAELLRRPPRSRRRGPRDRAGSAPGRAAGRARPRPRRAPPRPARSCSLTRRAPRARRGSARPSASGSPAAPRPAAAAPASARRRRAARRTARPRPCARARRGTRSGSARAARRSIMHRESRRASITEATPSSLGRRADPVGDRLRARGRSRRRPQ